MDVGAALREARYAAGWSQRELAHHSGVAAASISRYESGARQPSLGQLDRVLAACGKDLQLVVVERHHDVDGVLADLAALPLARRLTGEISRAWFVEQLASLPANVHLTGTWAAQLAGLPVEPRPAHLLVPDDDDLLAALSRLLRLRGRQVLGTRISGVMAAVRIFRADVTTEWEVQDVGRMTVTRLLPGRPWPPSIELPVGRGAVRVPPPEQLQADRDGVRPDILSRWHEWRRETELPVPVWREG